VVFESQVDELKRAADGAVKMIDGISGELNTVKATLARSTADPSLYEIADSIQERLLDQRDCRSQNSTREISKDWTGVSVQERLYEDVVKELGGLVDTEYEGLKDALDMAGVSWTPGRGVQ